MDRRLGKKGLPSMKGALNAKGFLNRKGLLFTIMTLFIILTILGINSSIEKAFAESTAVNDAAFLISVSNRFDNIERGLADFDKAGYNKTVVQRFLPFSYSLGRDANSVTFAQDLPASGAGVQAVFDFLNIAQVFLEDGPVSSDSAKLDINVPKNSSWGGTDSAVPFLLNPFCYGYAVSTAAASLSKSSGPKCVQAFSPSSIRRIDINVTIKSSSDDYNLLLCNGGACPQDAYNPGSPNPYYSITVNDSACVSCILPQKTASAHFVPSADLNIYLSCAGAGCSTTPLSIKQKDLDFNFSHPSGAQISVSETITFNSSPQGFIIPDVNISVADYNRASKSG